MSRTPIHCKTPPPPVKDAVISFPERSVLLIRLNRPESLNAMEDAMHHELDALYGWLDGEPALACAVLTGTGRAFCAGADLKEWRATNKQARYVGLPASGFGGLSRREGKKPVIAAVNGLAVGGGCEMAINADLVVASEAAVFALPEGRRGVLAAGGSLSRLVLTVGKQRAMEMALTGRSVSASEAAAWGLVNVVVPPAEVVDRALELARTVAECSPDSVIVTRQGVMLGWHGLGADEATKVLLESWYPRMNKGANMVEGVNAYAEKRKPKWVASKL